METVQLYNCYRTILVISAVRMRYQQTKVINYNFPLNETVLSETWNRMDKVFTKSGKKEKHTLNLREKRIQIGYLIMGKSLKFIKILKFKSYKNLKTSNFNFFAL